MYIRGKRRPMGRVGVDNFAVNRYSLKTVTRVSGRRPPWPGAAGAVAARARGWFAALHSPAVGGVDPIRTLQTND